MQFYIFRNLFLWGKGTILLFYGFKISIDPPTLSFCVSELTLNFRKFSHLNNPVVSKPWSNILGLMPIHRICLLLILEVFFWNYISLHKSFNESWNLFAIVVRVWIHVERWLRHQLNVKGQRSTKFKAFSEFPHQKSGPLFFRLIF